MPEREKRIVAIQETPMICIVIYPFDIPVNFGSIKI